MPATNEEGFLFFLFLSCVCGFSCILDTPCIYLYIDGHVWQGPVYLTSHPIASCNNELGEERYERGEGGGRERRERGGGGGVDLRTCQCCCTDCHTATLPELLMATSCVPTKNRPSMGIFISKVATRRSGFQEERTSNE